MQYSHYVSQLSVVVGRTELLEDYRIEFERVSLQLKEFFEKTSVFLTLYHRYRFKANIYAGLLQTFGKQIQEDYKESFDSYYL